MNFGQYARTEFFRYQRFAESVRTILDHAITTFDGLPAPQSIQARAKTPSSLRRRLEEVGQLQAEIEKVRRDLAGVRLIFYTNNDVDRFLNSGIVFDNFDVDRDATKIHHPVEENGENRYRAIHFTVSLNQSRASLPEYKEFADLKCEIQIQTILIHSWAETSHDIIYKTDKRDKFGNAAMEQIKKRFDRIMDKYLVPAGYEFQRAQLDYERLLAGKALFDDDLLQALSQSADNNERYERIDSLLQSVLPLYDDVPSIFPEIVEAIVQATTSARKTEDKTIETAFGTRRGWTAVDVILKAIEIINRYRYVDIERAFGALQHMFDINADERVDKAILEAVGRLAAYDIEIWEQVGPLVQLRVAAEIRAQKLPSPRRRLLAIEVWKQLLAAEMTGTRWHADSVTWSSGEVPIAQVSRIRETAIEALFGMLRSSEDEPERRKIVSALEDAGRTPGRSAASDAFLIAALHDHRKIVEFFIAEADTISFELRQRIENHALYAHYRAQELMGDKGAGRGCQEPARDLDAAILRMRDHFDSDPIYVRHKTLVGFEGVVPDQWDNREFDHQRVDKYRDQKIEGYLSEVTEETKADWLQFLERCAATKSDDLATFPKLGKFITGLAETKPKIAEYFVTYGNHDLLRFLPGFLNGLYRSSEPEVYERNLYRFLDDSKHLSSISKHWRASKPNRPEDLVRLLQAAVAEGNLRVVGDCVLYVISDGATDLPDHDLFFRPAIRYLTAMKEAGWAPEAWMPEKSPFLRNLERSDAILILENLQELPRLDYTTEQILAFISEVDVGLIWQFLKDRLGHPRENDYEDTYDAAPDHFQTLRRPLATDAGLAVSTVFGWYREDAELFTYRGGKVFEAVFPKPTAAVSAELVHLIEGGGRIEAEFALDLMQNYHGETVIHDVFKAVIKRYPDDQELLSEARRAIQNTGVVHGEFGFVESARAKKDLISSWIDDEDPAISSFAKAFSKKLDFTIASESRQADGRNALRRLKYEEVEKDTG